MKKNNFIKIAVLFLCMALVAGIYSFGVIPSVRKEEQEKCDEKIAKITEMYVSVPIYNGEITLTKGTIITEALTELFTSMEVPAGNVNGNILTSLDFAYGFQLAGTLSKGEPLTYANLEVADFEENGEERLKEFGVTSLVCGNAVAGSYIDVLVRYEDGTYDVVLAKKRVFETPVSGENDGLYTIVIAVDETEFSRMSKAETMGTLDTRVYTDESHEPSQITFGVDTK